MIDLIAIMGNTLNPNQVNVPSGLENALTKNLPHSPLFNVLLFSSFWAFQIFAAKLGFNAGGKVLPFQILMVIAAMGVLGVFILPKSGAGLIQLFMSDRRLFWKLYLANGIQSGLGTCLSIIGMSLTEAVNAGFLLKLTTVTTIFFAWLILNERITFLKVFLVFSMLSGAYLLTTKGQVLIPKMGDLFLLGACFCWSLGSVLVRKVLRAQSVHADVITLQKPLAGLPVVFGLVGVSLYYHAGSDGLKQVLACCNFSAAFIPYALGSGIFLSGAWIYLYRTLSVATASYLTLMSMSTPIIVSVLAVSFLGERLVWVQMIGAGVILLSGLLISFSDIAER